MTIKVAGFYLLGRKAYQSLVKFITEFGSECISYVVIGKDIGVDNDYSLELMDICSKNNIKAYLRGEKVALEASIKFSIGWRWMLEKEKLIVFHDSLLPKYRGFSPLVNMLIEGEPKIGVTALIASSKYDEGDILNQLSEDITYPIKIDAAIELVSGLYAELLCGTYRDYVGASNIKGIPQEHNEATYSLWRGKEDYYIDWTESSSRIERTVNALGSPYEGARTLANNDEVIILDAESVNDVFVENRSFNVGKIIFMDDNIPIVICGQGLIKLNKVVFINDNKIKSIGFRTKFGTRQNENSKS
ncbi:hypothetical protein BCV02_01445 [Vibrio breoganii]|uniref:Methionyl-tRNA formyltransferase n=1 Tax=Vibrio breoganii TaxID=553239 RepID=A0AAP8SVG4_9VIBR|nr:formyltransferase family protein [Vibrio breoganii]NMO74122.1 methionyl-tRNA formyltransferase [Vibrio breoganii]NMR70867.1 methionyl-tRNA formyltransferase [Vibrio breoganii]PMG02919.1 hypothetical protein BCV02_01445 [Vibrio breoganii]PML88183.1 hypothetical protein BCT67_10750 [Vibrio breoganii]PMP05672.1 hypothetical protein BCS93_18560 [Vibrio breoganii]